MYVCVCVPVVRLCSMYRPGLMEENTSSFYKIGQSWITRKGKTIYIDTVDLVLCVSWRFLALN